MWATMLEQMIYRMRCCSGRVWLHKDALRQGTRKDADCEWKMSVGRLRPGGPADITKQTCNFQSLKLSIRRSQTLRTIWYEFVTEYDQVIANHE